MWFLKLFLFALLYYLSVTGIVFASPVPATDYLDIESEGSGTEDGSTEVCSSLYVQIF